MKKIERHHITATAALAVAIAVMVYCGINFTNARNSAPLPEYGPSVTEVRMLSEWFDGLAGTAGDTPVYVLEGQKPGGSMLILGGTHPNEPSGFLSAFLFIENAVVEEGTVYVIPYANHSAITHNDPGEGNLQYFDITTPSGVRTFRFGSRATNPVDQWPDPDVYIHYPSGQQLSGSETRNINRAYPGRPDGNLTEKMAYGISELIRQEDVNLSFDLHEASPEYPVINATVAHERSMGVAASGCVNLLMMGIEMSLESSPVNFHGLTHREWGDHTETFPILMETANASQGRLRGRTSVEQVLGGWDKAYVYAGTLGILAVPYDESGHPIESRCGRHLQGVFEYSSVFNEMYPESAIVYSGVPGYMELFATAPTDMLGGPQLGTYLK